MPDVAASRTASSLNSLLRLLDLSHYYAPFRSASSISQLSELFQIGARSRLVASDFWSLMSGFVNDLEDGEYEVDASGRLVSDEISLST